MAIVIRGAGDIATGIASRLYRSGFEVIMTDLAQPTSIRRTVCFSEAILFGEAKVEDMTAVRAEDAESALRIVRDGRIAVLPDETGSVIREIRPEAVVDAILAKRNLGTRITDAPAVIGVGPGFTAGVDCHAVIETMRGHTLGRVSYSGSAIPNTGIPGNIGGFTLERILRAPCAGTFRGLRSIGDTVEKGETVAEVDGRPVISAIRGTLRGILPDGISVYEGMKSGDVDPRCELFHCYTISDKALAVGGGVLEAVLHLTGRLKK